MNRFFVEEGIRGSESQIARIWTRDASISTGRKSRIWVFKGRRLPILSRQYSEMDPLLDFIRQADQKKALNCSKDDA